jgi:hypothetical protein
MRRQGARAIVPGDHVEDDGFVGSVAVMAVRPPTAGKEVEFDRAGEQVSPGIEDGALEIGTAAATGHSREDDTQGTAIFQPERAREATCPGLGHGRFIRREGRSPREGGHRGPPGSPAS